MLDEAIGFLTYSGGAQFVLQLGGTTLSITDICRDFLSPSDKSGYSTLNYTTINVFKHSFQFHYSSSLHAM